MAEEDNVPRRLLETMLRPEFYDHPVSRVELIETHISWVFLAGDYVYKLKKPLNLGFLDFSTLEKRQHFCTEELRLNRRFAPEVYLDVVAIGGEPEDPRIGGDPALDYAVKMKRFPQDQQLDRMLAAGRLATTHLERCAELIATLHQQASRVDSRLSFGCPATVIRPALKNFSTIRPLLDDPNLIGLVDRLQHWTRTASAQLESVFRQRREAGFVRDCHGDLHLSNMAWFNRQPLLFDCIEFSAALRWIDVINDVAFLLMDLDQRGEQTLGWRFLNHYLAATGDYTGLKLLNFYKVYRALVRAKVLALRLHQQSRAEGERAADQQALADYLGLAVDYCTPARTQLLITHGLSGSGKTRFSNELAPLCRAVSLHSDLERKRLHQLAPEEGSHSPVAGGIYGAAASRATYDRLRELAGGLIQTGFSVMIDATFLHRAERRLIARLAEDYQVPLRILAFNPGEELLRQRLRQRTRESAAGSEATEAVLDYQLTHQEPLTAAERAVSLWITPASKPAAIARQICP